MNINSKPPTLNAGAAVPRRMASSINFLVCKNKTLNNLKSIRNIQVGGGILTFYFKATHFIEDALRRGTAAPAFRVGGLLLISLSSIDIHGFY